MTHTNYKFFGDYLNQNSTQQFLLAAKNYVLFCEHLSGNSASKLFKDLRKHLIDLYNTAYHLKEIEGDWPEKWEEARNSPDASFNRLRAKLLVLLGTELKIYRLHDSFSNQTPLVSFWAEEFIDGLYLDLKEEIGRIESQRTPDDVEIACRYFKHNFENIWGHDCAAFIYTLHSYHDGRVDFLEN